MPAAQDTFQAGERILMNDKEQIELVKIAGRLRAVEQRLITVEQDVGGLKCDMTVVKNDVATIKNDMAHMKGQIDVIVKLLSNVVSLIKIPDD